MDILSAIITVSLLHTMGHYDTASMQGRDISLHRGKEEVWSQRVVEYYSKRCSALVPREVNTGIDYYPKTTIIEWQQYPCPTYALDAKADTDMHGAGFHFQDEVVSLTDDKSLHIANGLYKLLYMLYGPVNKTNGDISNMEALSGNRITKNLLIISAISDIFIMDNMNVRFIVENGSPGLMITIPI